MEKVIFCVILLVASGEACFGSTKTKILYEVNNALTGTPFAKSTLVSAKKDSPLIEFMDAAADKSSTFEYTGIDYGGTLGMFITSINGLYNNVNSSHYWLVFQEVDDEECLLPLGASSYVPSADEHIIWRYLLSDAATYANFTTCA